MSVTEVCLSSFVKAHKLAIIDIHDYLKTSVTHTTRRLTTHLPIGVYNLDRDKWIIKAPQLHTTAAHNIENSNHTLNRDRQDQKFQFNTDTFLRSKSIPLLIIKIGLNRDPYLNWYQENVPGLILIPIPRLLNKNSAQTLQIMNNPLDWYWDLYRDFYPWSRPIQRLLKTWIKTNTDTQGVGIDGIDKIPIFTSVSDVVAYLQLWWRLITNTKADVAAAAADANKLFLCTQTHTSPAEENGKYFLRSFDL